MQRIRELEMPLQSSDERPEIPRIAPQIIRTLPLKLENVHESQTLHLEAQIMPVDDNQLKVGYSLLNLTELWIISSQFCRK